MADVFNLASGEVAGPGEEMLLTHPRWRCEGREIPCCIHSPSDHHMRTWKMDWRDDTGVMERICPHGTGHPDPDHMTYVRSLTPEHKCIYNREALSFEEWLDLDDGIGCIFPHLEWQAIHGCDDCCIPPEKR
jgi:hypothetical protein